MELNGKLEVNKMKIKEILKPLIDDLISMIGTHGNEWHCPDDSELKDMVYVMIGDDYIPVDVNNSYWTLEDDGTIVFRINDY